MGLFKMVIARLEHIKFSKLVCLAFHGLSPLPNMIVNYKDGNKLNDRTDNLEWLIQCEIVQHTHDNGLINTLVSKPVFQLDLKGNLIAEFKGVRDASKDAGFNEKCMSKACRKERGTSVYNGYIWKYVDRD